MLFPPIIIAAIRKKIGEQLNKGKRQLSKTFVAEKSKFIPTSTIIIKQAIIQISKRYDGIDFLHIKKKL